MSRLLNVELDDITTERLLEIARRHCKLVVEFGGKDTTVDRRKAIRAEIERLRTVRDAIIGQYADKGGEPDAD